MARYRLLPHLLLDTVRVLAWKPEDPGWRLRGLQLRADRLELHLGIPDEVRAADIVYRHSRRSVDPRFRPG